MADYCPGNSIYGISIYFLLGFRYEGEEKAVGVIIADLLSESTWNTLGEIAVLVFGIPFIVILFFILIREVIHE